MDIDSPDDYEPPPDRIPDRAPERAPVDTPAARRCARATASRSKTGDRLDYYQELRTADAWDQAVQRFRDP
jgi:hypothetical protein